MILEVLDAHGVRARHRLEALPLTLGRALANDVILDDPYVDGRHARIARDEAGAIVIEDLGSVNGLVAGEVRLARPLAVRAGDEVRLGRTVLRFRDPDEPVAPALVDEGAGWPIVEAARTPLAASERAASAWPAAGAVRRMSPVSHVGRLRRLAGTTPGRLGIATASLIVLGISSWLGTYSRSSSGEVIAGTLAFAVLFAIWAGIWAVASRVSVQRFNFVGHFSVVSVIALAGLALMIVDSWLTFLYPDSGVEAVVGIVVGLALVSTMIAWHLSLSSTMSRMRRWRAGLIVSGAAVALGAIVTLTEDETFTDVPTFSGVVKPVAASWVPTSSVEDFGDVMRELKDEVDVMAAEMAGR